MTPIRITAALLLTGAALLGGCAAVNTVGSDVATYGEWPAGRAPASYRFERLPSQQALGAEADALEAAAAPALAKAGFKPAAEGQAADVVVQVGSRIWRVVDRRWDERLWWGAGFGGWYGRWGHPWRAGVSWQAGLPTRTEREVALLIRDGASGKPLFEARAASDDTGSEATMRAAMFEAALQDFPKLGLNPRRVVVTLPPAS
jgi:hypothetical protein